MPRPFLRAIAAAIGFAVFLSGAPASAQFDGPFGIQIARGPSTAAARTTDAPGVESIAWIDPSGLGQPVQLTRGFTRAAPAPTPLTCLNCGGALADIQGVVLLPLFPRHQVWWDWTTEYRRYYAGRVF